MKNNAELISALNVISKQRGISVDTKPAPYTHTHESNGQCDDKEIYNQFYSHP